MLPLDSTTSLRPTVRTFYLLEPDILRKDGTEKTNAFMIRDKLRRAVQQATGSVTFSRDRTTVFHRSAESRSVRHTVHCHAAYEWQPTHHTGDFFNTVVRSAIDSAFVDGRDAVIFSVGNTHSLKSTLLHGKTLAQGSRMRSVMLDQTADWGLLHRSANYLIDKLNDPSEQAGESYQMSATACCIQMDHASDILVPPPVKDPYNTVPTREEMDREQNRLVRLVALARASTLDTKVHADGSITTVDQSEMPVKSMEDVQHIVNCLSAVDTHREEHLVSSAQSAPFYLVTTLVLRPQHTSAVAEAIAANTSPHNNTNNNGSSSSVAGGGPPLNNGTFRIRFVECADFDWSASDPEDTEHARRINASLTATLCALSVWQREIAMMRVQESLTCRLIFGNLQVSTLTALVFGTATYKAALPTMDFIARVRDSALWVALHGADGEEDEAVVDEELKSHMSVVQQQCDDLRRQVVRLNASKELLAKQVDSEDQKIQQLQEQLSLLRRLTADNVRTREELIEVFDEKADREQAAQQKLEQEKASERESKQRASRIGHLERELDSLRQEDALKDAALEAQIQSISAETRRLINNSITLEHEADALQKKINEQDAKYEEIQKAHEQQKIFKMNELMDQRWAELEAQSRERLEAVRTAEVNARNRQNMTTLQNRAYAEEMNKPLAEPDVYALRAAKERIRQLELDTAEVETTRKAVIHQLRRDAARAREEVNEAEAEQRILGKYLHDITRILWRFENTSGYVMDNLSQLPKLNVPVFDPLAPVNLEQLRALCRKCRLWLQQNAGEHPPAVAFDVEHARAEILDVGFSQWMESVTNSSSANKEVF